MYALVELFVLITMIDNLTSNDKSDLEEFVLTNCVLFCCCSLLDFMRPFVQDSIGRFEMCCGLQTEDNKVARRFVRGCEPSPENRTAWFALPFALSGANPLSLFPFAVAHHFPLFPSFLLFLSSLSFSQSKIFEHIGSFLIISSFKRPQQ